MVPNPLPEMNPVFIDERTKRALSSHSYDDKPDLIPASDESSASEASAYSLKSIQQQVAHAASGTQPTTGPNELAVALVKSLSFDCIAEETKVSVEYRRCVSLSDDDLRGCSNAALRKSSSSDTLLLEPGPVSPRDNNETSAAIECDSASDSRRQEKCVSWGNLEIRKYPTIPGVHPDCLAGPPLTVAWEYCSVGHGTIDCFEAKRKPRRQLGDLRLSWLERRRRLRSLGFSELEMHYAHEESKRIRKQRERTVSRLQYSRVEEFHQALLRKIGRSIYPKKVLQTKY